jgi:NADPH2:quinone reductase
MFKGVAWRLVAFGETKSALQSQELTWPPPAEGQVLVRVLASGVSLPDLLATTGTYPPIPAVPVVLGLEAAGEVVAVPEGSGLAVGDRVMGMTSIFVNGFGGHAEYAYLLEAETRPVPTHLSDEQAAGFVIGFRTAHAALVDRCAIKSGETLVVLGAAGNSGASAVQLGKALGAKVIAVASNQDKLAYCEAVGADHLVNYTVDNVADQIRAITGGRGADVIFDPVGGDLAGQAVKAIARYGRIVIIGFASGSPVPLDAFDMLLRQYSAIGLLAAGDSWDAIPQRREAAFDQLIDLVDREVLRLPTPRIRSFGEVPEVISQLDAAPPGKTAIRVRARAT